MAQSKRKQSTSANGKALGASDWLQAAREELIRNGILSVKVDRLARRLRVSRGSFYWHFKSHPDLLKQLLTNWNTNNTEPFKQVLKADTNGYGKFLAIVDLWLSEQEYDPKFDAAVREWARVSPPVARVVRRADEARIAIFEQIFKELGYRGKAALVRARITYFHQVGYYALGILESRATRTKLTPYYTQALLGIER